LDTPIGKERTGRHEKRVDPLARKGREGRIDLVPGVGVEDLDLQPHSAGSRFYVFQHGLGICSIGRIDEHGYAGGCGDHLTKNFQPLCHQLDTEKIDACRIAARPGKAGDKTQT
jgi:hypothetical protein